MMLHFNYKAEHNLIMNVHQTTLKVNEFTFCLTQTYAQYYKPIVWAKNWHLS